MILDNYNSHSKMLVSFCFFVFIVGFFTVIAEAKNKSLDLLPPSINEVVILSGNTLKKSKTNAVAESEVKFVKFSNISSANITLSRVDVSSHPDSIIIQKGIDYILNSQNPDGSWGMSTSTKFITTSTVLDTLQIFDTKDPEFDTKDPKIVKGLQWLSYYFADNYDYLAQKLKTIIIGGEATTSVETLLNGFDDETGGFIFDRGYESDTLTTARVVRALNLAGYKDTGSNENFTQSLAVQNLIRAKKPDMTWSVFPSGVSSIPVSSEVIEAISLWKGWSLGGVIVNDTLNPAINTLKNSQLPNGSWNDDILNTAFAFHAIKFSGNRPAHELKAVDYFINKQLSNGSWDNNLYKTAKVLSALSLSTNSGNFIIKDIIPVSSLQTGLDAILNIQVHNPGDLTLSDGLLHIVADNFLLGSIDLRSNSISIDPGVTGNLLVSISNTRRFVGDVNFKIIYEREGSNSYFGSRYAKQLTFATDPELRPGYPTYFAVYKNIINSTPAITWRWPQKANPYQKNIVVFWKKLNDPSWTIANVTSPTATSATVGNLIEGQIYEATLGTSDINGNIYYYVPGTQVKVSAGAGTHKIGSISGTVKSMTGAVSGVLIAGVNSSSNVISGADGVYSQNNLPWGTNYVKVSDPLYETFVDQINVTDNTQTAIDLYTSKRTDLEITQFFVEVGGDIDGTQFTKKENDDVYFTASFKNKNDAVAGSHLVGFYVDNIMVVSCEVPRVEKMEYQTYVCGPWRATRGLHRIEAVIDAKNIIEEISETNNNLIKTLEVVPAL